MKKGKKKMPKTVRSAIHRGALTRARSCTGKHAFTRDKAERMVVAKMMMGVKVYIYPCVFCDQWHLTSRANPIQRR